MHPKCPFCHVVALHEPCASSGLPFLQNLSDKLMFVLGGFDNKFVFDVMLYCFMYAISSLVFINIAASALSLLTCVR